MITEADMTYEEMQNIALNPRYKCGDYECGGILTLAWGGSLGYEGYILRCGNNVEHSTITKYDRKREEYMQEARDQSAISSLALMKMSETEMVERVTKSKFVKDLTPPEKARLAIACVTYGLDPIMGELTIYQGNPFVTVDGRFRKAQETGKFDGISTRPATKQERDDWEIPEGDKFFRSEVFVKNVPHPFVGWGRVTAKEMKEANALTPLANHPHRICEKRADVQALRKAFSIPLPSAEFIGTPEERAETIIKVEGVGDVSKETGEIKEQPASEPVIEVEFQEVTPEPELKAKPKGEDLFKEAPESAL